MFTSQGNDSPVPGEEVIGVRKFSSTLNEDVAKGIATEFQLYLWDSHLTNRIKLQGAVQGVNKLPHPQSFAAIEALKKEEVDKTVKKSQDAVDELLGELFSTQTAILIHTQNKDTKVLATAESSTNKRPIDDDDEITSEEEDEREEKLTKHIKVQDYPAYFKHFSRFRNSSIQKWEDKTSTVGKGFSAFAQSSVKQIEKVMADTDRLVKRTQLKRSSYSIVGKPDSTEEVDDENPAAKISNPEIFDDDDYYHQLLRELIERKTADIDDPVERTRHWLQVQQLRRKGKKKIDTRASKGRKIRYHVHKKMVNFMAPDRSHIKMSDEALDALFSSLPNNPSKTASAK